MNRLKALKILGLLPTSLLWYGELLMDKGNHTIKTSDDANMISTVHQNLPEIFIVGDSISIQYGDYLEKYLDGFVKYYRKRSEIIDGQSFGTNGGNSKKVLDYIKIKLKDSSFKPTYLIINCGLHDIKRSSPNYELEIPLNNYANNIEKIIVLLKSKDINPVWITTTPVFDSLHNSRIENMRRYSSDLTDYNNIARQISSKHHIPVVDLYNFTLKLGSDSFSDHVHFKESVSSLQAAFITGFIQNLVYESIKDNY